VLGADIDRSGKKSAHVSNVSGTGSREGADLWLTSWCQKAAPAEWDLFPKSTFLHRSMSCYEAAAMFSPFHSATTLALTSTRVVGLRLEKIAAGGVGAFDEAQLMVSEKLSAAFEAAATLASGGTSSAVMDRYQALVNANVRRLSRR
jgi:hypothetical protein